MKASASAIGPSRSRIDSGITPDSDRSTSTRCHHSDCMRSISNGSMRATDPSSSSEPRPTVAPRPWGRPPSEAPDPGSPAPARRAPPPGRHERGAEDLKYPPAGLLDHDLQCRPVPRGQLELDHHVGRSARDEAVAPGISEPAVAPSLAHQPLDALRVGTLQPVLHPREHEERTRDAVRPGYLDRRAVQASATAGRCLVSLTERREVHDADHWLVVHREGDQVRPDLDAVGEVLGPIDRVHDPATVAGALGAPLLAENAVVRVALVDRGSDRFLDRDVGLGDRAPIRLETDLERATEEAEADRARTLGQSVRELELLLVHARTLPARGSRALGRSC